MTVDIHCKEDRDMNKVLTALIVFASVFVASSAFAAGDCDTDADCESYETCEVVGESSCACAPGDAGCDCPDGGEVYRDCVPEPPESCESDADCSDDLECVTQTYEQCSGGGSTGACQITPDGGTECEDAGTPDVTESCETITEGYCVPSYIGPCEADADCGEGFACEPYEVCECPPGSPVGPGGDGAEDAGAIDASTTDSGDGCTCEVEGNYCELIETECTTDADCSGDLTCQTYEDTTADEPACIDDGDASSCTSADAGNTEATRYCLPPNWERWAGVSAELGGSSRDETDDGANEAADAGQSSAGADDGSSSNAEGGCSISGERPPVAGLALALLGLMGLAMRRRR
jgi:MYXO-CTERM domain-containing protein